MTCGALSSYETVRRGGSSPAGFAAVVAAMGALAAELAWVLALRARRAAR